MDFWLGGSYFGIIIFLILTGAGLPIPEEVAIVYAGVQSSYGVENGGLDPTYALAACLIGAIVGDCVMYWIGYSLGLSWLRHHRWVSKFLHVDREKQMEIMIQKHGLKVFFLARFMVGVRGPIYLTAGILKVSFRRFLIIDVFCATIVVGLFFSLSYFFGEKVINWIHEGEIILTVLIISAVVIVGLFFYIRHRRKVKKLLLEQTATRVDLAEPLKRNSTENNEEKISS